MSKVIASLVQRFRFRWGITATITASMVVVIALIMTATTLLDVRQQRYIYLTQLDERGQLLTGAVNDLLVDWLYRSDVDNLDDLADIIESKEDVEGVWVFRPDGTLLVATDQKDYPTGRVDAATLAMIDPGDKTTMSISDGVLWVVEPVEVAGDVLGGVAIGFSTAPVEAAIRATAISRLRQSAAVVAVGVLLSYLLAQYFIQPLRRLVRATQRVAEGKFESDVSDGRRDEIGELAASFEGMARAVQQARVDLELRVDERTAELRASEATARSLSQRLVQVQESERRGIARELHDEIGQELTGLRLLTEGARRQFGAQAEASLDEAVELVDDLMTRVRDLSLNLRPSMLDDMGLLPALLWLVERDSSHGNLYVKFEHSGLGTRLDPDVETAAYRVVQEALTNVLRHANTSEVTLQVWVSEGALGILVEDRGSGFDPSAAFSGTSSIGLPGMRERVELLGGVLTLESAPGKGTRLEAEIPVEKRARVL